VLPLLVRGSGIAVGRLFSGWASPLGAGVVAALPTLVLARIVADTDSLAWLAVVGAAWSLVYAAVAWRIGLTASERWLVRSLATTGRRSPTEPELPEITELND
jgi:hypothetical protein